jgi:hypothetical protein
MRKIKDQLLDCIIIKDQLLDFIILRRLGNGTIRRGAGRAPLPVYDIPYHTWPEMAPEVETPFMQMVRSIRVMCVRETLP